MPPKPAAKRKGSWPCQTCGRKTGVYVFFTGDERGWQCSDCEYEHQKRKEKTHAA